MDTDEKHQQNMDDIMDSAEKLLSSQTVALEILTNLCSCSDEFDEMYEDLSCSESSLPEDGIEDSETQIEPELKKELIDAKLFQRVIEKAKLPPENILTLLKQQRSGFYLFKFFFSVTRFKTDKFCLLMLMYSLWLTGSYLS